MNLRKNWKKKSRGLIYQTRNNGIFLNKRGQALVEYVLLMVVFVIILTTVAYYVHRGYEGAFNNFVNTFKNPYTY